MTEDSRYHRQRHEAREHPNRKDDRVIHHNTSEDRDEVAERVQDALARWKESHPKNLRTD